MAPLSVPIAVSDAAQRLRVHHSQIHQLLRQGDLRGSKIAGRWFIDAWSLERQQSLRPSPGRPYDETSAWALLNLWEGHAVNWVSRWQLSRFRQRLREDQLVQLAPRLRRRASVNRCHVHRGLLGRLASDRSLARSGISAADNYNVDVLGRNELEAYVGRDELPALEQRYALSPDGDGNVVLHAVDDMGRLPLRDGFLSPVVVALDLMESVDSRARRAGKSLIHQLRDDRAAD